MKYLRVKTGIFSVTTCIEKNEIFVPGDCVVVLKDGKEFLGTVIGVRETDEEIKEVFEIIRRATPQDISQNLDNRALAERAYGICKEKIKEHNLDMKLIETEISLDGKKAIFYFVAPQRVDFRRLVRDLANTLKLTIEMKQIGVRDATKVGGGIGPCGLPLCCGRFINDFESITLRMVREQNLFVNPQKISGICGRLMCCLAYEADFYSSERKKFLPEGTRVSTPRGDGIVKEVEPISQSYVIKLDEGGEMKFSKENVWAKGRGEIFYVTTPIYYVNDVPHIGHSYTTIAADVLARFQRLNGKSVFFLTGTDEHGKKIEKHAETEGVSPKELADRVVQRYKELWKVLNISNDDFIRTTEKRHEVAVVEFWKKIYEKGDIYLGDYEDWYCVPCESFWTENELVEGKCPSCGRDVEKLKEKTYFFRLSKYQEKLLRLYEENPNFIMPESKRNEVISFVKEGLRDISISRRAVKWGIKVPSDEEQTIYVWFDALVNYLSGVGYPDSEAFSAIWPADIHFIGKDILRFHAVYWPAFLMSAGLPLPKTIFAHGWWTVDGKKMSKSLGNVVDPKKVVEKYGVDQFRFFLFREVPFGLDGDFSVKSLVQRINSDLANNLGNLAKRTLDMSWRYFKGSLEKAKFTGQREAKLKEKFNHIFQGYISSMEMMDFYRALTNIWSLFDELNRYLDENAPWKLWQEKKEKRVKEVLSVVANYLRFSSMMLYPFMPESVEKMWELLGMEREIEQVSFKEVLKGEVINQEVPMGKGEILFPKVEE